MIRLRSGLAGSGLIFARHLDRAFDRFGARVLEEHEIREAQFAQPCQPAARPPESGRGSTCARSFLRLLGDRLDHMRMGMTQRIDRDAGGEIEIALAVRRHQPRAPRAPLESEVDARIGRQQVRELTTGIFHRAVLAYARFLSCARNERRRLQRAALWAFYWRALPCQPPGRARFLRILGLLRRPSEAPPSATASTPIQRLKSAARPDSEGKPVGRCVFGGCKCLRASQPIV